MAKGSQPVLVGVGQVVDHWNTTDGIEAAPSPLSLARTASQRAIADSGATNLADHIDTICFVRIFEDSIPKHPHPHGHNANLPGTLARDLKISPDRAIYSSSGGQTPQALLMEMANRILDGEVEAALVTGSEANLASKRALRAGETLNWADAHDFPTEDRSLDARMLTRTEIKHGLVAPPRFYALMENAIAAELKHTPTEHTAYMSKLFKRFSDVAVDNPYAQYAADRSEDYLSTPTADNYPIASPFLKWHIAQDAVNQAAAVIIMSEEKANALGIDEEKRVYLIGGAGAEDTMLSERQSLTHSKAMDIALNGALDMAGLTQSDIAVFDLYSCFPCAVYCASQVLGIDPLTDPRPITVTGGLPYFGGAGNNYSLHGIASMIERMREQPNNFGLVLANGGWMTKEAAGIYSAKRPDAPVRFEPKVTIGNPVAIDEAPEGGVLESYTVLYGKRGAEVIGGIATCRTASGDRFMAVPSASALEIFQGDHSPIGRKVSVATEAEVNTISFA